MRIGGGTVTTEGSEEVGEVYPPGSPEDLAQVLWNLNQFFTNKVKAIELYRQGLHDDLRASSTNGTFSVCHIDGTDDGDGGGKLPDSVIVVQQTDP
jgi:hypothetical protein